MVYKPTNISGGPHLVWHVGIFAQYHGTLLQNGKKKTDAFTITNPFERKHTNETI